MQNNNRHLEILQVLAAGNGEVFPADSLYNQPEFIRALFFALNELRAVAEKGNQGLAKTEEEDNLLTQRYNEGIKITYFGTSHRLAPANRLNTRWNSGEVKLTNHGIYPPDH